MKFRDLAVNRNPTRCWRTHKISYDKRGALSAKNHIKKADLRIYDCPFCHHWHLTKQLTDKFMSEEINEQGVETPAVPEVTVTDLPADGQPVETPASTETTAA